MNVIIFFLQSMQAFVWKNNVYVKETPNSAFKQVTSDGARNLILNGIPDWVYEGKRCIFNEEMDVSQS